MSQHAARLYQSENVSHTDRVVLAVRSRYGGASTSSIAALTGLTVAQTYRALRYAEQRLHVYRCGGYSLDGKCWHSGRDGIP